MNKSADQQVAALERAILDRANELADEFRAKAEHRRDTILREAKDKLTREEERETNAAKANADRAERRQVQSTELKMQGQLDKLRWELVQAVHSRLTEKMADLRADREAYRAWLILMIREGAELIPEGELIAELIAEDIQMFRDDWEAMVREAAPNRTIALGEQATWGNGGVKLRDADKRTQVDNRFEGRIARFESDIQRIILQSLFPRETNKGGNR